MRGDVARSPLHDLDDHEVSPHGVAFVTDDDPRAKAVKRADVPHPAVEPFTPARGRRTNRNTFHLKLDAEVRWVVAAADQEREHVALHDELRRRDDPFRAIAAFPRERVQEQAVLSKRRALLGQ